MKLPIILLTIVLSQISILCAEEPQDLVILRGSYHRAIERAISPIQERYIGELKKLKTNYTKEDKLREAIIIDKEITKVLDEAKKGSETASDGKSQDDPKHLFGEWYCNDVETDIYIIKPDKMAIHASDTGTWTADQTALIITWANGFSMVIDLKQTGDTVHGRSYRPGAKQYDLLKFNRKNDK